MRGHIRVFLGPMGIRDGWTIAMGVAALLGAAACKEESSESGSRVAIRRLAPGEREGCLEGAVVLTIDGLDTGFCTAGTGSDDTDGADGQNGTDGSDGTDGTDGANGVDGADGSDGQNGSDGADGEDGTQGPPGPQGDPGPTGPAGPAGDEASFRTDCVWCTPGVTGCAPDGMTEQECVDDGDGCGHWEAVSTCAYKCLPAYRTNAPDALGNYGAIEYRCVGPDECSPWQLCGAGEVCVDGACENATSGGPDCRTSLACPTGNRCVGGACVVSEEWLVANASLHTDFDGRTHSFSALSESLSASCVSAGSTYWNGQSNYCSRLSIGALTWTESDEGVAFSGAPLTGGYMYLNDPTGLGTYDVSCGSMGAISGNRFQEGSGAECSVTITEWSLGSDGHVGGTFSATRHYKGHDEPDYPSTLNVKGSFRIAL